jgi:hypothetical protein
MRRVMMCLLVLLALWEATSWKAEAVPQWRVIMEGHRIGGTETRFNSRLFTPQPNGVYRLTASCSAIGEAGNSRWTMVLDWTDLSNAGGSASVTCTAGQFTASQQIVFAFTPQAGIPVTLTILPSGQQSTYDAIYTIEELQ